MRITGWLRRLYMRSTSLSISGAGSRAYVRWLYAVWSWFYDLSIALDPAFRRGAAAMVDATVADDDRVLDLGIGTGLLAELGAVRAAQWIGLDYSASMLARARRKLARRGLTEVTLQRGDALHPPYGAGSFDAVVSSFMLPHFDVHEKPAVLAEMARLLRPGGRLGLFLAQGEEAPLFSTRAQLERWLSQGGFTDVVIEDRDDVYRVVTSRTTALRKDFR